MSALFDDLCQGLQEAIEFEKGNANAKVTRYTISPVKKLSNIEFREIRMQAGMTQKTLADYMGGSKKTVEAWERGRSCPTGPAFRLLDIIANNRSQIISNIN